MNLDELQNGDIVYAAVTIANDGSVPEVAEDEVFAHPGTRGMLINTGHLEEQPDKSLYLIAFESAAGELGPPVGCFAEEVTTESGVGAP